MTIASHVPLHVTIRSHIRDEIAAGRLRPGDKLPSEPELAARFRTTRNTVRHALAPLVFEGLVVRSVGLGSFVGDLRHESSINTEVLESFEDQMAARGIPVRHRLIDFAAIPCPAEAAGPLGLARGARVYLLRRLRLVGEDIIGLELRYIVPAVAERLDRRDLQECPAINMIRAALGIPLTDLEVTVLAVVADAATAKLLGCRRGSALLVRRHLLRGPEGAPVLFGESRYRGDRYRFTYHLRTSAETAQVAPRAAPQMQGTPAA